MKRQFKVLASALTILLVTTALVGCGKKQTTQSPTGKLPTGQTITVWSHLNDDEVKVIKAKAEEWAKNTGNTVKVIKDNGKFESMVTAAKSPSGPDVMFGLPHDHIGQFVDANVAAEIPNGTIDVAKFSKGSVDAGMYNGKMYGVPVVAETYALFYNKDLVKDTEVPKTWEELIALGKKVGFEYNVNDFYFSYSVLAGNGAYVFKNENGKLNPKDIGLGNEGAVKGYQMIKDLIDQGIMKASVTGDIAKGNFASKKIGLYISGPWDVGGDQGFKAKGLNFGVAKLPAIGGKPTPSFMGVQVAIVNPNTKNKELSFDLLKYLEEKALDDVAKCGRMPVYANAKYDDPQTIGFADQVKNAQPMPNIPEMAAVWGPGADTLKALTSGKTTPEAAAKSILENINKGISAATK